MFWGEYVEFVSLYYAFEELDYVGVTSKYCIKKDVVVSDGSYSQNFLDNRKSLIEFTRKNIDFSHITRFNNPFDIEEELFSLHLESLNNAF